MVLRNYYQIMKNKFILFLVIIFILYLTSFSFSQADDDLGDKLKGRILLQVESNVNLKDSKRHYMKNGD